MTKFIRNVLIALFVLTMLVSNSFAASFSGDWRTITPADLFKDYYTEIPKVPNETRLLVFGLAPSYDSVGNFFNQSLAETNAGIGYQPYFIDNSLTRFVKTNDNVRAAKLSTDINAWAAQQGVSNAEVKEIYRVNLMALEEKVIDDADYIYYDLRDFFLDDAGHEKIVETRVSLVNEGILNPIRVKLPPVAITKISEFTFKSQFFTALEYQEISSNAERTAKTVLTWGGVRIADADAEEIARNAFQSTVLGQPQFGTKLKSMGLYYLETVHNRRVAEWLRTYIQNLPCPMDITVIVNDKLIYLFS